MKRGTARASRSFGASAEVTMLTRRGAADHAVGLALASGQTQKIDRMRRSSTA